MDTRSIVLDVLRELEIDSTGIDGSARLRDDLEIDSTELIEVAVALERRTEMEINTEDVLALKTFDDLVTYVDGASRRG